MSRRAAVARRQRSARTQSIAAWSGTESAITVAPGTTVYYCYTVTNDSDQNVDALMNTWGIDSYSRYWTNPSLTFSFPDSAADFSYSPGSGINFAEALNAQQQAVVRAALAGYDGVSNLAFTELAFGSPDGTLRFVEAPAFPRPSPTIRAPSSRTATAGSTHQATMLR